MPEMLRNNSILAGKRVAVFGLGYVGLPLIRNRLNACFTGIDFDVDQSTGESLRNGSS